MNLSNPVGGAVWCHSGAAQKKGGFTSRILSVFKELGEEGDQEE